MVNTKFKINICHKFILLSKIVAWCITYKNMHGVNDMKNKNVYLIFPNTFVRNIFHSEKKWARYDRNCILTFT
jgi:hypothetical protein